MGKLLLTTGNLSVVIAGDDVDAEIVKALSEAPPTAKLGFLFQLSKDLEGGTRDDDTYGDTLEFVRKHGLLAASEPTLPLT